MLFVTLVSSKWSTDCTASIQIICHCFFSESSRSSFSSAWLKKAYQRAKDQAEEEGKSFADIVRKRYGVSCVILARNKLCCYESTKLVDSVSFLFVCLFVLVVMFLLLTGSMKL